MQPAEDISAFDIAYSSLVGYAAMTNPAYLVGRHHALIADKLEAIERGDINRLIICMPPRHGKTMLASQYFPAWYMGRNPSHQIIATTYSHDKASDTGREIRNQMTDPMFNATFPDCFLSRDSRSANKLTTTDGGIVISTGIHGSVVGRGANLFLIDDPLKSREEAESDTVQRKIRNFFRGTAYTRLMSPNAIIIIMTRWHFYDLVGWCLDELKHENWEVLSLPAVSEEDNDLLGRNSGDALWPERYCHVRLGQIKRTVGTREWTAQYQQSPLPSEGGLINLDWFERYTKREQIDFEISLKAGVDPRDTNWEIEQIVTSWDTAYKEAQLNDPSAATIWGVGKKGYYLLHVINKRMGYPELRKTVLASHEKQKKKHGLPASRCPVLVEDAASGQSLIQDLKANTTMPVIAIKADKSKEVRMSEVSALIEAGRVILPERAKWLVDYETQLAQFPYSRNDDIADSTSQFLRWVGKPRYVRRNKPRFWK